MFILNLSLKIFISSLSADNQITDSETASLSRVLHSKFALALEVLLADGTLEKEEKNVIEILSNRLKLEAEMTSKIIEVIFLKNKGNIKGI